MVWKKARHKNSIYGTMPICEITLGERIDRREDRVVIKHTSINNGEGINIEKVSCDRYKHTGKKQVRCIMTIKKFIQMNRKEIDSIIKEYYGIVVSNESERHEWILSDEGLYRWAHREGVNI